MSPRTTKEAIYDVVIGEVFRRLRQGSPRSSKFPFDKNFVVEVMEELYDAGTLPKKIKNIPDVKYTYDSRRDFPPRISQSGYWAIIGRGKGKYYFCRLPHNNLIRIPEDLPRVPEPTQVADKTPSVAASVLGDDEQATLTRIRYCGLMDHFLGIEAFQVQSHERTTVSAGQVEIDEVYVAGNPGRNGVVAPVSAKGGEGDFLSYAQAWNLTLYAVEKEKYRDLSPRPVGMTRGDDGYIYIIEFTPHTDIAKIRIKKVASYEIS